MEQVLFILLVTCGEMAIVLCYFQLCNENYLWQWRAFLNTGSAGIFLFGYSFVYFSSTLEIMGVVSTMLYFGDVRQPATRPSDWQDERQMCH